MRLQLARPGLRLVSPELYNQLFTMHGTTMMFLFAVPVMQAVAMYLVPLMIGARSVAFPRMNAFAFWVFVMGGRSSMRASRSGRVRTRAGSATCRSRRPTTRRARAWTSGRR
jgi:heme/copper-type cytochrome/quinol oxidase subunit 1